MLGFLLVPINGGRTERRSKEGDMLIEEVLMGLPWDLSLEFLVLNPLLRTVDRICHSSKHFPSQGCFTRLCYYRNKNQTRTLGFLHWISTLFIEKNQIVKRLSCELENRKYWVCSNLYIQSSNFPIEFPSGALSGVKQKVFNVHFMGWIFLFITHINFTYQIIL